MCSQALAVNGEFLLASFNGSFPACSFCSEYIETSENEKDRVAGGEREEKRLPFTSGRKGTVK